MKTPKISKGRLDAVLEAVDAAILTIDSHGIVIDCNAATSRLFGYSRAQLLDQNVSILMPEPYRGEHDQYIFNHLSTGINRIIGTGRKVSGRHIDGNVFPLHLSVARFEENGKVYFTGILHDLSELDEAHSMSSRLGLIVEESVNEVYSINARTFEFTSANRAGYKNLGYSKEQLLQLKLTDVANGISAETLHDIFLPLNHGEKKRVPLLAKFKRADGTLYEADASFHLTGAFNPPELIAIVQDATEKNRLLESIHRNQRMESIGNLTGGIAHDFNNILTVIMGNLELLDNDLQGQPDAQELVHDATEAAEMGARLTKRLLAFARRSPLKPDNINVNKLIVDLSEMLSRTLGSSIALENRLDKDLWDTRVDISELENALVNLVINARDAMPDGGRLVVETKNCHLDSESVLGKSLKSGKYIEISVTDTGEGIPELIKERIFEPFVTSKKTGQGSGMGLSMVYGFVTQSGGGISVYSEPGQGTKFSLYLPKNDAATGAQAQGETDRVLPAPTGKTILIAEDDEHVRKVVVKRIQRMGHTVIEAADGYECLALFKEHPAVDLVFSDITMTEGMTGYDLALAVKQLSPTTPVLLTSGYAEDIINAEKLMKAELSLLRKPYDQKELEKQLALLL